MEGDFNHEIGNKDKLCIIKEDQLLLYIRGQRRIRKNCVIYALKMEFTLLDKRNELMLSAPTRCAAEGIGRNTVHTALNISIYNVKSLSTNVSGL